MGLGHGSLTGAPLSSPGTRPLSVPVPPAVILTSLNCCVQLTFPLAEVADSLWGGNKAGCPGDCCKRSLLPTSTKKKNKNKNKTQIPEGHLHILTFGSSQWCTEQFNCKKYFRHQKPGDLLMDLPCGCAIYWPCYLSNRIFNFL